jgi:hypothetical protein
MQTISNRFHAELNKILTAEIQRLKDILGSGMAVKTMDDYQKFVGQIDAFKRIIEHYGPDIETLLDKR